MKNIVIIILLIIISQTVSAQEVDPLSFFPSAVGNVWEYDTPQGLRRFEIFRDSTTSDSSKFVFYYYTFPTYKIDTNRQVFEDPLDRNWLYYKLDADSGDSWMVRPETPSVERMEARVEDKYPSLVFG